MENGKSYEERILARLIEQFDGFETREEALRFANYAITALKSTVGDHLTLDKAEQYVPLLAQLLHKETHSIYGSGVFDYPEWKATADARRHLGLN